MKKKPKRMSAVGWAVVTNFQGSPRHFAEIHVGAGTKKEHDLARRCYPLDFRPHVVKVRITQVPAA